MALNKIYTDETAARRHLERLLWPDGPSCPHCGNADPKRIHKLQGKSTREGVHKCNECEKPFSVTVGTVFESSHVPLHKWVYATHLLTASKKGISSHQLMRMLGVSYKTAWFMSHRIREGMRPTELTPMGGSGKIVESDETYIGRQEGHRIDASGYHNKNMVLTLVERGGAARSFHTDGHSIATIVPIVRQNVRRESKLMTDASAALQSPSQGIRAGQRSGPPRARGIRSRRHPYQHGGRLLFDLQTRNEGYLPALQREAPTPLFERV